MNKFLKHIVLIVAAVLLATGMVANSRVHSHARGLVQNTTNAFGVARLGEE